VLKQRTLKNAISATGVGLHSGQKVSMTLRPAPSYRHRVLPRGFAERPDDQGRSLPFGDTRMCTGLEANGAKVMTVDT